MESVCVFERRRVIEPAFEFGVLESWKHLFLSKSRRLAVARDFVACDGLQRIGRRLNGVRVDTLLDFMLAIVGFGAGPVESTLSISRTRARSESATACYPTSRRVEFCYPRSGLDRGAAGIA